MYLYQIYANTGHTIRLHAEYMKTFNSKNSKLIFRCQEMFGARIPHPASPTHSALLCHQLLTLACCNHGCAGRQRGSRDLLLLAVSRVTYFIHIIVLYSISSCGAPSQQFVKISYLPFVANRIFPSVKILSV